MRVNVFHATSRIVLIAGTFGVVVSACSAHLTTSRAPAYKAAAERAISDGISKQGFGPLTPSCDMPTSSRDGQTFNCTAATIDGRVISFSATIANQGVDVVPTNVLSVTKIRNIEKTAARVLSEKVGTPLKATDFACGNSYIVYNIGDPIACTLSYPDGSGEAPAVVTLDSLGDDAKLRVTVGVEAPPA
jgi:hypothetical protein